MSKMRDFMDARRYNVELFQRLPLITPPFEEDIWCAPPKVLLSLLNRGCGVEIEVENSIGHDIGLARDWVVTEDHSLRNAGLEYISAIGCRVYHLKSMLKELSVLFQTLREEEDATGFVFSERTSVHVHLDVRDFTMRQMASLLILYSLFEHALFGYVDPAREHNVFTIPLSESNLMTERCDQLDKMILSWDKYCAFNMKSIRTHGTIEFRHMQGNLNPTYIWQWILILSRLVRAAERKNFNEIKQLVVKVKSQSNYEQLLSEVFGPMTHLLPWDADKLDAACSDTKLLLNCVEAY